MAIDVSQMALAQRLKETVTVTRVDLDNDPTGNTTVSVAIAIEIVIAACNSTRGSGGRYRVGNDSRLLSRLYADTER